MINSILPTKLKVFLLSFLFFCLLSSVINYIIDVILTYEQAMEYKNMVFVYFLMSLYSFYIIFPAIILYYFMAKSSQSLVVKILIALIIGYGLTIFPFAFDWSLYIGKYRIYKQIFVYCFSGVSIALLYECYFKKWGNKVHST